MSDRQRVLGIDTSLRSTGVAVVASEGRQLRALAYGPLKNRPKVPLSECLVRIAQGLEELIDEFLPDAVAIEGAFFSKNARTAMILGEARGVAIVTCAKHCIPVFEYAPRRVKQSLVGNGAADKSQVRRMVMSLLGLSEEPQEDAGDALALAICHLHRQKGYQVLEAKRL